MQGARRHRALLGAVAVLLIVYTAFSGAGHLPTDGGRALDTGSGALSDRGRVLSKHRAVATAVSWPQSGQAAFVLGEQHPSASPYQLPAPIASLAKVMTAYLTLQRYPIEGRTARVLDHRHRG